MFKADRVFFETNHQTGRAEWFFSAREGIYGPFVDKARATHELDAFIKACIKNGDDGGRKAGKKTTELSLVPMHDFGLKRGR